MGVVGLLVAAKDLGLIPAIRPLLDALQAGGFHLDEGLISRALRDVDEI